MAYGMRYSFDKVLATDVASIRRQLISHYGNGSYYLRRNGEKPIPPAEQAFINNVFKDFGYEDGAIFDSYKDEFQATIEKVGNGLEKHLNTPIEFLSGGQRQALSLLMATLKRPELLLLDEHTAALDPKTSVALMELTDEFVKKDQLTALMITHHMEDALKYGNRLIVMKEGRIIQDLNQEEKAKMKISDYYQLFE